MYHYESTDSCLYNARESVAAFLVYGIYCTSIILTNPSIVSMNPMGMLFCESERTIVKLVVLFLGKNTHALL